jgi:hypothetical protein
MYHSKEETQAKEITYQSMTPEDIESFITGNISWKAAFVNPFHVFGHQPPKTYINSPKTNNQLEMQ